MPLIYPVNFNDTISGTLQSLLLKLLNWFQQYNSLKSWVVWFIWVC